MMEQQVAVVLEMLEVEAVARELLEVAGKVV